MELKDGRATCSMGKESPYVTAAASAVTTSPVAENYGRFPTANRLARTPHVDVTLALGSREVHDSASCT